MKFPTLPKKHDRRRKINPRHYAVIRRLFFKKGFSCREISQKYKVSYNAIRWIVYPEKHTQQPWKERYKKRKHAAYMRRYISRKKSLQGHKMKRWRATVDEEARSPIKFSPLVGWREIKVRLKGKIKGKTVSKIVTIKKLYV